MPVLLKGVPARRPRGGSGVAFDRRVRAYAQLLLDKQAAGYVTSRELEAVLNEEGAPSPRGPKWSEATIYRMLKRGGELGIPFKRRGRSEAASRRKVIRRSKDAIAADMLALRMAAEERRRRREAEQTDAGTIA